MIFRRKSTKAISANLPETYALIPVCQGKNRSSFSNRIVSVVEESSFCSASPLVKRLIVKNVKVWCIVIETSGTKSVRIICASVPYMLNLVARASPRFKALLEDERVVSHLKSLGEIDFEALLTSLCSTTMVIHNGVKKCYPIISVYLGNDALIFTKSSLNYLKNLFLLSVVSAFHFLCEDMPNIMQSLCSQNYAIAKYFVQNLPVIALSGAKHFLLFTLFMQRLVASSLKTIKNILHQILLRVYSEIDFVQLSKIAYLHFRSAFRFIASHCTFKIIQSTLIRLFNVCYPILRKYIPLAWAHTRNLIAKCVPIFKTFINKFLLSIPKILKFCDDNKSNAFRIIRLAKQCGKDLLCEIKPFCDKLFRVLKFSYENILHLVRFLTPYIELAVSEMLHNLKILFMSENTRIIFQRAVLCVRELSPIAGEIFLKVCRTLTNFCKYVIKSILSSFSIREKACRSYFLFHEMNSFLKPVVSEMNSTCHDCADEVMSKSYLFAQKASSALWCSWKVVTPVTFRASYEIYVTAKSATVMVCPELLKAAVVVFPELEKGFTVVMKDSSCACTEVTSVSYLASQELLFAAKCVSSQLPLVFRALSEVSVTSSMAATEIFITTSKARIRVKNDLDCAIQEVSLAIDLVYLEFLNIASDLVCDMNLTFSNGEIREMLVFLSETNYLIFSYACNQYFVAIRDFSVVSYSAVQFSSTKIKCVLNWVAKYIKHETASTQVASKNYFANIYNILNNFIFLSLDCAMHYSKLLSLVVFNKMLATIPVAWGQFKITNAIIWNQFCKSSSQLWTLLELEGASAFQFACFYTPELWEFLKRYTYQTWQLTCDVSPALWEVARPVFPVLWATNCSAVQCVWGFHVRTCSSTWKVIVPVSSSSWEYLLKSCPKTWTALCKNSKYQWNSFCDIVEFSWNAMSITSSLSWKIIHTSVSKSWKRVLRPVTVSACGGASSAVSRSLKLSNTVCSKSKEFLLLYKTSLYDFSDITLE